MLFQSTQRLQNIAYLKKVQTSSRSSLLSSRRTQILYPAMPIKLTFTAKRTAAGSKKARWQQVSVRQTRQLLWLRTTSRSRVLGSAALQPSAAASAVWVRQLKSLDGKEFIGNAFQVKGVLANVDDLKKAIKAEEELSIAASKIDIYSQKDGRWVKEARMSASLHDTDEADCYGFVLPA
ncbi:unnamed protein product [Effrenium voratum]|nr:unnamed protein product [Effrenium voratum]